MKLRRESQRELTEFRHGFMFGEVFTFSPRRPSSTHSQGGSMCDRVTVLMMVRPSRALASSNAFPVVADEHRADHTRLS